LFTLPKRNVIENFAGESEKQNIKKNKQVPGPSDESSMDFEKKNPKKGSGVKKTPP